MREAPALVADSALFETLRQLPFFGQFSETEVWEAVRMGERRAYEKGIEVIKEGTDDTTMYVVESGELEAMNRGVRIGRIPPGRFSGDRVHRRH
jgi:signal-transduction protein with cAMP-binding, CBS, and nucleotidyltransferase domain